MFLQNLRFLAFERTWNQCFLIQLKDSIVSKINESEQDVVCIISNEHEQASNNNNIVTFTIHIFSHNSDILQETHEKLNVSPKSTFEIINVFIIFFNLEAEAKIKVV